MPSLSGSRLHPLIKSKYKDAQCRKNALNQEIHISINIFY